MTAEERRTSILVAARREFSRSGFHGASTARIAAAASCSEPMLYKHFSGKQALFAAVLAEVSTAMEAQVDGVLNQSGDPLAHWLGFLPEAMESDLYAEMVGLRKLAVTLVDQPEICAQLRAGTERLHERVRRVVTRAKEHGSIRADVDPDYVAWMWLGITLVASYRHSMEGSGGFAMMHPHAETFLRSLEPH